MTLDVKFPLLRISFGIEWFNVTTICVRHFYGTNKIWYVYDFFTSLYFLLYNIL